MKYIETDRLVLRDWKLKDLPLFIALNKDEGVMRFFPSLLTEDETESLFSRIQSEFDRNGWGLYTVELKSTGDFEHPNLPTDSPLRLHVLYLINL